MGASCHVTLTIGNYAWGRNWLTLALGPLKSSWQLWWALALLRQREVMDSCELTLGFIATQGNSVSATAVIARSSTLWSRNRFALMIENCIPFSWLGSTREPCKSFQHHNYTQRCGRRVWFRDYHCIIASVSLHCIIIHQCVDAPVHHFMTAHASLHQCISTSLHYLLLLHQCISACINASLYCCHYYFTIVSASLYLTTSLHMRHCITASSEHHSIGASVCIIASMHQCITDQCFTVLLHQYIISAYASLCHCFTLMHLCHCNDH